MFFGDRVEAFNLIACVILKKITLNNFVVLDIIAKFVAKILIINTKEKQYGTNFAHRIASHRIA